METLEDGLLRLFARAKEGLAIVDSKLTLLAANDSFLKILFADEKTPRTGLRLEDILQEDQVAALQRGLREALDSGEPFEMDMPHILEDGRRVDLSVWAAPLEKENSSKGASVVIVRDMTQIQRLKRRLEDSEQYFREIVDNASDGVLVLDEDGRVYDANKAIEEMTGYTKEEILDPAFLWYELFSKKELYGFRDSLAKVLTLDVPSRIEVELIRKGQTRVSVIASLALLSTLETWKKERAVCVLTDISDLKRLEEELKYYSFHDTLTGLYNRAYFEKELERISKGRVVPIGLIVADIDNLKETNEKFGHDQGDKVIQFAAGILMNAFRKDDVVARVGGDEYAVILPGADEGILKAIIGRIERSLSDPQNQQAGFYGLSFGYSLALAVPFDKEELIRQANAKLYKEQRLKALETQSRPS